MSIVDESGRVDVAGVGAVLSPCDPRFEFCVTRGWLSREFTQVRLGLAAPTRAFRDGTARARRDRRVAERVMRCALR